jgi:hypothetical protein
VASRKERLMVSDDRPRPPAAPFDPPPDLRRSKSAKWRFISPGFKSSSNPRVLSEITRGKIAKTREAVYAVLGGVEIGIGALDWGS